MSTDAAGEDLVAAILPIAGFRIFPSIDLEQPDLDRDALGAVTEEAPADIVAWLHDGRSSTSRRSTSTSVSVAGGTRVHLRGRRPARRRTACGPAPEEPCAATFWAAGRSFYVAEGEVGQVVELDVAGQPMLVIARDDPAAETSCRP